MEANTSAISQRSYILCRMVILKHCGIKDLHPLHCPSVPCGPMPIVHRPLQHIHEWQKNAVWVSLDPSALAVTSAAPRAAFTLSHISTAKQECLPLLLCLNFISSLAPSNSPIALFITLPLSPFFTPSIQNFKKKREKCLSTSKKHRDERLFRAWWLGKWGLLCLWNAEGKIICGFWTRTHEPCMLWGHTSNLYKKKG